VTRPDFQRNEGWGTGLALDAKKRHIRFSAEAEDRELMLLMKHDQSILSIFVREPETCSHLMIRVLACQSLKPPNCEKRSILPFRGLHLKMMAG
jgi:hypothetical protein